MQAVAIVFAGRFMTRFNFSVVVGFTSTGDI